MHGKHRRVLSYAQVVADRKRHATAIGLAVPTAFRVEAGWDRAAPFRSFTNRLPILDVSIDTTAANAASATRNGTGVSVPDAQLGAAIQSAPADRTTVLASDP